MDWLESSSENNIIVWLILGYFYSYPSAKDTAAGVRQWWLEGSDLKVSALVTEEALDYLVRADWVRVIYSQSGLALYGLNPLKQAKLQHFLFPVKLRVH